MIGRKVCHKESDWFTLEFHNLISFIKTESFSNFVNQLKSEWYNIQSMNSLNWTNLWVTFKHMRAEGYIIYQKSRTIFQKIPFFHMNLYLFIFFSFFFLFFFFFRNFVHFSDMWFTLWFEPGLWKKHAKKIMCCFNMR